MLRRLTLATHIGLAGGVGLTLGSLELGTIWRVSIALVALLPLAASLPGLMAARRSSMRWLALALVFYAGLGAVEVIARTHPAAVAVLLCALIELALVLSLTRAPRPQSPRATGES
jgi:Predicted membrane protein (DUF2069)